MNKIEGHHKIPGEVELKKKIILFLMALFLGISWIPNASASGQLNSTIVETKSIDQNNCGFWQDHNCMSCVTSLTFTLYWFATPPSGGQWTGFVYARPANGNKSIIGEANQYQGTYNIEDAGGSMCPFQIQQIEQSINNAQWQVSEDFVPTNGTQTLVNSNVASIINPSTVSLASTVLVSPNNMTFTPDPVNIFSGEAYFSSTDFSLGTRGPKLALFRKYRSFSTFVGMFGYGWRTDFDVNLTQDSSGDVIIYNGEGTGIYFTNYSGTYMASPGNYSTLVKNADNTYTLTDKNGIVTHYDITGRLTSHTDRNGNALTFVYNPAEPGGTYIQDASDRKIVLNFNSNGYISSATDPAGKTFQYGYDVNGNLVSVTDPTGAVTNYTYNSNHQIIQFTNANGHNTYYQYNTQGQVTMNWRDNNVNKTTLNYEANNITVVTDSLGNNNTYVFNPNGLLISRTDPLGAVTQQTWDVFMNRLSITGCPE